MMVMKLKLLERYHCSLLLCDHYVCVYICTYACLTSRPAVSKPISKLFEVIILALCKIWKPLVPCIQEKLCV